MRAIGEIFISAVGINQQNMVRVHKQNMSALNGFPHKIKNFTSIPIILFSK